MVSRFEARRAKKLICCFAMATFTVLVYRHRLVPATPDRESGVCYSSGDSITFNFQR